MSLRDPKLLCQPIIDYLVAGKRPSWEIEEELAVQFKVTTAERAEIHPNSGCPVWRNDVAFALKKLRETKMIGAEKIKRRAPYGGLRGIYYLLKS